MSEVFSFGEWVRRRRRALDLTQDELAHRAGCTVSMVRKIELEERRPSKQLTDLLANALELRDAERMDFRKVARASLGAEQLPTPDGPAPSARAATSSPPMPPHLLPASPTRLIGREHDLVRLHATLEQPGVRLVTLTGPGGIGKTRLALQLAAELAPCYADGARFVDLARLTSADQVLGTIAHTLGIRELLGTSLRDRLCEHLHARQLLLLLDNFEHVLDAAPLVAELLRATPRLTVLVTSRVVLRLSGENEYAVPPLGVPEPQAPPALEQVAQADAVRLFVERAQAARPSFALTEANAASVVAICRLLDGLPLAIELAAARVKLFPPETLQERLGDRFRLLTGGARDLPERQRTLRSTIDWSYHLLAPAEQRLFRRLAVFSGGWTIEAVTEVCDVDGDLGIDVIDGLQVLLDHSLIRREAGSDGAVRFRRLETIREYARELLSVSGEAAALQRQHATFFLSLAEQAEIYYYGTQDFAWMERLATDYDNLQTALVWSTGYTGDTTIALRLVAALWKLWLNRRPLSDGYYWIETVLDQAGEAVLPELRAKALNAAGIIALYKGDTTRAERWLTEALALYEVLSDDLGCAEVLNHLGIQKVQTGQYGESLVYQEASFRHAKQAESQVRMAWALSGLGRAHTFRGDTDRAVMLLEESLALDALHGNGRDVVRVLLAKALMHAGHDARAIALLDEALPILRAETGANFSCLALITRARIARAHGDVTMAETLLREGLARAQESGAAYPLAHIHYELSLSALEGGDVQNAQAHIRESLTFAQEQRNPWLVAIVLLGAGGAALAAGEWRSAHAHYARSLALLHDWRENLLARQAALSAALAGLVVSTPVTSPTAAAQAARICGTLAVCEPLTDGRRVTPPFLSIPSPAPTFRDAATQAAKGLLGETAFAKAWAAGREQTLEQALAEALEAE